MQEATDQTILSQSYFEIFCWQYCGWLAGGVVCMQVCRCIKLLITPILTTDHFKYQTHTRQRPAWSACRDTTTHAATRASNGGPHKGL